MDRDNMLMLLARKYFQSHSPATFGDFVWWTGLGVADCRKAICLLGDELRKENWNGYEFYIHESCRTHGFRRGNTLLLPPYDEYLIAYKTRELALPREHMSKAHTNNGIFFPVILRDGVVCGNWSPWKGELETKLFDSCEEEIMLDRQWNDFVKFKSLKH